MKKLILLSVLSLFTFSFAAHAQQATWELDPTFGADGTSSITVAVDPAAPSVARYVRSDAAENLYVQIGVQDNIFLKRFLLNGAPDNTFFNQGTLQFSAIQNQAGQRSSLELIQNDGVILRYAPDDRQSMEKYLFNGVRDPNFNMPDMLTRSRILGRNIAGLVAVGVGGVAKSLVDGKLMLGNGYSSTWEANSFVSYPLVRYNSNGSVDADFDNAQLNPVALARTFPNLAEWKMSQASWEDIYEANGEFFGFLDIVDDHLVTRILSNGHIDPTWPGNGAGSGLMKLRGPTIPNSYGSKNIAILPVSVNGVTKLLTLQQHEGGCSLARRDRDGSLDLSFGNGTGYVLLGQGAAAGSNVICPEAIFGLENGQILTVTRISSIGQATQVKDEIFQANGTRDVFSASPEFLDCLNHDRVRAFQTLNNEQKLICDTGDQYANTASLTFKRYRRREIPAACGNSFVDANEQCDDGNHVDNDQCSNACHTPICGDNITQVVLGETCDDGNRINTDKCPNTCRAPVCGDGITQALLLETCDDGNRVNTDKCSNTCKLAVCGDRIIQAILSETCDDGNAVNGDGCSSRCVAEPKRK